MDIVKTLQYCASGHVERELFRSSDTDLVKLPGLIVQSGYNLFIKDVEDKIRVRLTNLPFRQL